MSALDTNGQRLNDARGVIADMAHHEDAAVLLACAVVVELSDDTDERAEAEALRDRLDGVWIV